jgi:hypothetical protein
MLTLQLDYGNPFEQRTRVAFDYFNLRASLSFGTGRKLIDNIVGQALYFGKNIRSGKMDMLIGIFQHYDYWDTWTFEMGTMAFGPGVFSKLPIGEKSDLYFDAHVGIVPFAGNSTQSGPDTNQLRDYNFGGGAEAKLAASLNLGEWGSVSLRSYYYWIHTYAGAVGENGIGGIPGDNLVGIVKPSIQVKLYDNLSLGFEHLIYYSDRYMRDFPAGHTVRTEQKIFLQYYIDNFKPER